MTKTPRKPSAVDEVAERYTEKVAALSPMTATMAGIPGHDGELDDLSPAGLEAAADLDRATLKELDAVERAAGPGELDEVDRVTLAAMRERLGLAIELNESGERLRELNSLTSPVQSLRDIFDVMPTDTTEAWENISSRLGALPRALDGYTESLKTAAAKGHVAAIRQVREATKQARELAGADSFFATFAASAPEDIASPELREQLIANADAARAAYGKLADYLEHELAPQAPEKDAFGRERYARLSREFLGAEVDLEETYQWGLDELARIDAEQQKIAQDLLGPGATVKDAMKYLDNDPKYQLHGKDELVQWMQSTADDAINNLAGTHFDIDGPARIVEAKISPTESGTIYYTPPSADFSRPGRMWWTVPEGVTEFNTWQDKTTVFHEGVPGHHLQLAAAISNKDQLNSWRRLLCWVSGHGEGWALYSEQLMADLGYLDDPGDRMGLLNAQRLRAARVVFDIGVHLELPCPQQWGGGVWTPEKGWDFLVDNVEMNEGLRRAEFLRYLGWPGQAPSYKIGQRLWEQIRDEAKAAAEARGETFDLRDFHSRALGLGSVGLDVLRDALVPASTDEIGLPPRRDRKRLARMEGVITGFAIIATLIAAGYLCARFGIGGGEAAEYALNRISFFVAMPALMFTVVSRAHPRHLFGPQLAIQMTVAITAAALYLLINHLFLKREGAEVTIGAVAASYVNSNNMGLPIAIFVLGDPTAAVPALLFNLLVIAPITALALDAYTHGQLSWKLLAAQPIRNPIILGTLFGLAAAITRWEPPYWIWEPLSALGHAAIPMMLMAFGMSLRGAHPMERGTTPRRAALTAAVIKSVVMPAMAFLLARFAFQLPPHGVLAAVVVAGLPTAQNVYNYAARYGHGQVLARDVVLLTTAISPAILLAVAAVLGGG